MLSGAAPFWLYVIQARLLSYLSGLPAASAASLFPIHDFPLLYPPLFFLAEVYKEGLSHCWSCIPCMGRVCKWPFKPWPGKPATTYLCHQSEPEPTARLLIIERAAASCSCGICMWMPYLQQVPVTRNKNLDVLFVSEVWLFYSAWSISSGKSAIPFCLWVDVYTHSTRSMGHWKPKQFE